MFRKLSILAALAATATVALAAGAGAQGGASGTCTPPLEDQTGDQTMPALVVASPGGTGPTSLDLKGGAFRMITDKAGKSQLVAEVYVDLSDKTIAPNSQAHTYWVWYSTGEVENFVIAQLNQDESWVFWVGTQEPDGFSISGETTGRLVSDGANGIVQIDIKGASRTLEQPYIISYGVLLQPSGQPALRMQSDRAPDSGAGEDVERSRCPGVDPPAGPPADAPAALDVTAGKAKARRKVLSVALRGNATNLSGALKKGRRTVASGKLAKLAGKATMKLKGRKKLKKGAYSLTLSGTTADGREATKTLSVRAR